MLNEKMEAYASDVFEEVKTLVRELAVIPAPSHEEDLRVEYLVKWLAERGVTKVHVDPAKNVIWSIHDTGTNDLAVVMAHTDVVFPDKTPLPLVVEDGIYRCPGITDDVAPLCVLLVSALYYFRNGMEPKNGLLIVANSCEEGLGNLKGSRCIVDTYGDRLKELITVEATANRISTRAVGSHRYRVTVETEGGHSFGKFGNRNAIRYLASMIDTLYAIKVPDKPDTKTTYNVGMISGGTSVNTIAQKAEMLYEYRSDDYKCLEKMKQSFEAVINAYRTMGIEVGVELLGERPCGNIAPEKLRPLQERLEKKIRETVGSEPLYRSGSTDANYPLSKGIPAACIGSVRGNGCHTREEFLYVEDLIPAVRYILDVLQYYFE
ncbi:MAG: M20/M25/M40 family metallo-hydrolase [Lachnospiraceae bacterium]|nr:M20/M25/M40 family metallo-hydrolase [Lachnospiraceae bacterium]